MALQRVDTGMGSSVKLDLPVDNLSDLISPEAFRVHQEAVDALDEKKRSWTNPDAINLDTASMDELRFLVKHLIALETKRALASEAPVGVDIYSGLPVHFEPPECPACLPFAPREDPGSINPNTGLPIQRPICHDCNLPIPMMKEHGNRGLESATITHMHMHPVLGANGRQIRVPYRRELCLPCYRIDFEKDKGFPCPF